MFSFLFSIKYISSYTYGYISEYTWPYTYISYTKNILFIFIIFAICCFINLLFHTIIFNTVIHILFYFLPIVHTIILPKKRMSE